MTMAERDPRLTPRTWLLGFGDGSYHRTSPALLAHRMWHRLTGVWRGCSCSRCFDHPRRRVPAREVYDDRVRLAELERRVRKLERP
jgi:hypothetical protein